MTQDITSLIEKLESGDKDVYGDLFQLVSQALEVGELWGLTSRYPDQQHRDALCQRVITSRFPAFKRAQSEAR